MALTTAASIALGLFVGGAGIMAANKGLMGSSKQTAQPTPLPQPPNPVDAAAKAGEAIRKKKAAVTQTVYTSPLGVKGEADVARKVLLGQ